MMDLYVSDFSMISSACRITKQNCGIYHIVCLILAQSWFAKLLIISCGMRFV